MVRLIILAIHFIVVFGGNKEVDTTTRSQQYFVMDNARYPNPRQVLPSLDRFECTITCQNNAQCASVNFETSSGTCEFSNLIPGLSEITPDPLMGWQVIYLELRDPVNMTDAVAWQSSIYEDSYPAWFAIDGNTDSYLENMSCFHTNNVRSMWAVELVHTYRITAVAIYFRNSSVWRTSKLRMFVALSREDMNANKKTEVAYYEGPPSGMWENPLYFKFPVDTSAKVFQIEHELDDLMHLCEIVIYG